MVQEKPPRCIPPTSGLSDSTVKCAGVLVAIPEHPVVLNDQPHAVLTGTAESLFQPQAVVTGVHIATSGTFDKFCILVQVFLKDLGFFSFPENMGYPQAN